MNLTGLLQAAKHCRKAEPPPFRAGSLTYYELIKLIWEIILCMFGSGE
jgi:hypothetical protein